MPFIFKYVFQLALDDENTDPIDIHGLYHVHPRNHKFGEDNIVSKLNGSVPTRSNKDYSDRYKEITHQILVIMY